MLHCLEGVEGADPPVTAAGEARAGIEQRARRVQVTCTCRPDVRQRCLPDVGGIEGRPLQLEVRDDGKRLEAPEVGGIDELEVGDLVAVLAADSLRSGV